MEEHLIIVRFALGMIMILFCIWELRMYLLETELIKEIKAVKTELLKTKQENSGTKLN